MQRPHGGKLIGRALTGDRQEQLIGEARELPTHQLTRDQVKDLENIAYGVLSPLTGFMTRNDYESVLHHMRLEDDLPWTIPIILDIEEKQHDVGQDIALLNEKKQPVGLMHVEEIYALNKREHALRVYTTLDKKHPGVAKTLELKDYLIGGEITLLRESDNPFSRYTLKPIESSILFREKKWRSIAGFQTRNVPHLGHEYVQKTALAFVDGIFINPLVGKKKKGDFTDQLIIKTYRKLVDEYYLHERAVLSVLRTTMRYAGPREAIFHAIMRKNFGCTHFIVGRDHAGVGNYYKPYEAQELFGEFPDLGIMPLFFKSFFYCRKCGGVVNEKTCPHPENMHESFSGTRIRKILKEGNKPPSEIMRPEIAEIILKEGKPFV